MTAHKKHVDKLKESNPNIRTHLCKQAIRKAVILRWSNFVKEALEAFRFVPDAYEIDQEEFIITIYEVEISNPISDDKMHTYWQLLHFIEDEDWSLKLIRVDRFGNHTEINIERWWHDEGYDGEKEAESKDKHQAQGQPERAENQEAPRINRVQRGQVGG